VQLTNNRSFLFTAVSPPAVSPIPIKQSVGLRHHTLPAQSAALQQQHLSLPKPCSNFQLSTKCGNSCHDNPLPGHYQFLSEKVSYVKRLDCSPVRREYLHCSPDRREINFDVSRRGADRSRSCDRYLARPLSPISRVVETPSPLPRSLSRGSSQSYQSSSADESGREGGGRASSSGIGLSSSSTDSSRRASCCSSGAGSSRLTYHSNPLALVSGNSSCDNSLNSGMQNGTPDLTIKDISQRSDVENRQYECNDESTGDASGSAIHFSDNGSEKPQSIESLENELTCPICLDLFHEPVLLPCSHSLCAACVERILASQNGAAEDNAIVFRCPTCRKIVASNDGSFPNLQRNLPLQNIVEGYRRAASSVVANRAVGSSYDCGNSSGEESR